jgi:predicted RNA-binding protein YlqC (UPF0109 family)
MSNSNFGETVGYIVRALVDHPDQVEVYEKIDSAEILIELRVGDGDMGRIIGRGGRVINAIRTVAQAMATDESQKVMVEVIED